MEERLYWIWLTKLNLCPKSLKEYLKKHTIEELFNSKEHDLREFFNQEEIKRLLNAKYKQDLALHDEFLKKNKINLISINDSMYPEKLRNIDEQPIAIYAIGNLDALKQKNIAIVGTRRCTEMRENGGTGIFLFTI